MKIAVVAPGAVPFCIGGAEKLWWGLVDYLNRETAHQADLVKLPSREHTFWDLVDSYEAFSKLDLSHFDLVVSTKYPAWMAPHPRHVCYLQHRLRGLYDTYHLTGLPLECTRAPAALTDFFRRHKGDPTALPEAFARLRALRGQMEFAFPGPFARLVIHFFDAAARITRYLAISRTVASRQDYFPPGVEPEVVHHPSNIGRIESGESDHFFTIARLDGRQAH